MILLRAACERGNEPSGVSLTRRQVRLIPPTAAVNNNADGAPPLCYDSHRATCGQPERSLRRNAAGEFIHLSKEKCVRIVGGAEHPLDAGALTVSPAAARRAPGVQPCASSL